MGTLGSASIKLNLDRSQFDSDLKKLQATDAGQIAYRIKLDTKDFERQIKGLSKLVSPVFIPLEIDTKTFDQQIKKLSTSIDPIKVDLAPNVKDFQEKLRRLSKITPVTVDIKVDETKVRQQFEQVGKYAAEGFTQGFSGVESAGKSAIDSMVRSVNQQLGIQSPSRVFREIGKYAIAGLMQGLDSGDTRAVVNKITSDFRAIDISAKVRLVADGRDLQRQITSGLTASVDVEIGGNSTKKLSDSIADSVAHAVKKTQSKGLFGGLLSMVALPLKLLGAGLGQSFQGLFLGAGLPLGQSLGAGIAKGVNAALKGKFKAGLGDIGLNLTDLSKADWNLAKAIDALFIEGNPIGKARKAVKDLQDVFADLKVLVAPGTIEKVVDFGKLSSGSPRDFRKKYLAAAKAAKEQGRELTPEQFTEELKPKAEFKAVGTAIKLAAAPLGFKNKVMSFEAQRQIEARSQKLIIPDISEPSVTLAVGGFQKERGRGSHAIAKSAKNVLPNSHVIAIPNTYTDRKATDTHSELLNFIKSLGGDVPPGLLDTIQNTEKLVGTAAHGYSPDAIRIAAYARAVQRKYPDKPVNAVAFSGGTYPLEQAIQFDTDAGGKAKGIGLGAGLYGLTGRHNPNYRAMIGEQDPLGFPFQLLKPTKNTTIIPSFADTASMDVHNPKRYFANPSVQGAMSEMFTGFVPPQGNVKAQESIFELTNRKVATDKHINRLNRFIADPTTVPSHKVDASFGELADFLAKQGADFKTIPTIPPQEIPSDPKLRTLPKLMASGDNLALDAQHYYSQVQKTYKKTSAVLAKPLNIPEAQLETYEPEQRVKVIRAVSKVQSEAPGLARTIDRIGGAPEDDKYSFFTRNAALAPKRAQDLKGLISYLRAQVFTDLPKDIDKLAQEYLKYLEELHTALAKFVETGEAIAPEILAQKDKLNLLSFDPIETSTSKQTSTTDQKASNPPSSPGLEFNSSKDVRQFASKNLNAKGMEDLARRMGIDTKNTNKEYLLNEITSLSGTADTRKQIAQLIGQLAPDKFLSASQAKTTTSSSTDASKTIGELKKARKSLADALKLALNLDGKERQETLEKIDADARNHLAIAKQLGREHQLTGAQSKSLGGTKTQLKNISGLANVALAETLNPTGIGSELGANLVGAIGSGISGSAKKPIKEIQQVMASIEGAAKNQAEIKSPSKVFQRIGRFITEGLALGISEGYQKVAKAITGAIDTAKTASSKNPIPPAPWEIDPSVDFRNRKPQTPPPPPGFNLPITKTTLPPPPPGFNLPIAKTTLPPPGFNLPIAKTTLPPPPPGFNQPIGKPTVPPLVPRTKKDQELNQIAEDILRRQSLPEKTLTGATYSYSPIKKSPLPTPPPPPGFYSPITKAVTPPPPPSKPGDSASASDGKDPNRGIAAFFSGLKVGKQGRDTAAGAIGDIFTNIKNKALEAAPILENVGGLLSSLLKGFFAFQGVMILQNALRQVSIDAFKAYVELDRLKTALNFASGGTAGGAQSLAFVRKTVDDLKIPLQASAEGFTRLAGATRNSAMEGKQTKDLFQGLSEASTVLSLSAEDTSGTLEALSKAMSQGRVGADLFDELGTRIPGVLGIAARAMGTTEEQFNRLKEAGRITPEDFFPKFSRQLHSEFGEAAKGASDNAPSAVFGVQNSFLELQQSIGGAVSPAATAGLNSLSAILSAIASHVKELMIIISAISSVLVFKLGAALSEVIGKIILTKVAGTALGGTFSQLGQTLNNSASVKWAAGIFAVLEVVNLLNQAINTELVQSFQKAADAAKRSAEETKKAFEKPKPEASGGVERFLDKYAIAPINSKFGTKISTFAEQENAEIERGKTQGLDPVATSGVGQFWDKYLVGSLNAGSNNFRLGNLLVPGGMGFGSKIKTWGEYERDSVNSNIKNQGLSNAESLSEARYQLAQFKTGTGEGGKLRGIDAELKTAEEQRAILQAQIKRDFVDKGQAIPVESKRQLDSQNLKITALNDQRSVAAKPLTLELNRKNQQINSIKTQLEQLNNPDNIANAGGEAAADKQRQNLKIQLEPLKQFKAELETALAALRIDPILAFTQSLRKLNLALAEGQEKSELRFNQSRAAITSNQVIGFSTNKLATRNASLQSAVAERDKNQSNVSDLEKADSATDATVNTSGFQSTLQRLGVSPDASVAKIDDVLKNTSDEADKGILEKLKSAREQKNKLSEARVGLNESQLKVKQTTQDNSLYSIDESAANSRAATTKGENQKITGIKKALELKVLTEEVANEKISRIQLASTRSQQKNLSNQLMALRTYHEQGAISAEEFAKRQRDLTTEQTNLEKQEAENRLAVQQTVLARRLKEIEFFNKEAEALTNTNAADSTRANKEKLLSAGLTPQAQDQFSLDQNKVDATTASDKVNQVKDRIVQSKQLYKEGLKDARDFMAEQYALNLELAQANVGVIDQKIAGEEKYRQTVDNNISRNQTIAGTVVKKQSLADGLTPEAQDKAALEQNKIDQKAVSDRINFIKSRIGDEKNAVSAIASLEAQLVDLKIQGEEKYRESVERNIQRIMQSEENRFKKQISQLDESKAKLDLYNQSLERTSRLEQSRNNLSKALSNAALAPLENQKADADDAQSLVDKLKDPKISRREKAAIKARLREQGYGPQTGVTVTPATVTKSTGGDSAEDYELQVKEKKEETEQSIARIKELSMKAEQEFQRKALENDLKRQKIAAQTLLYDAESAQLSAQKAKNEAEGALKIAIAKKDPLAIETAQTNLNIANKQIDLSNQRVEGAQANLNDQPEIEKNATLEQKVTQGTENQNFQAGESRRRRGAAIDLFETSERAGRPISLSEAEKNRSNPQFALPQRIDVNQMPKLDLKPGENLFDAYQRQREGMKLPTPGAQLPSNKVDMPPVDKTTASVSSASIQPRESSSGNQFVEALKMANQGIEQRLDALNSAIITLANTPRSLSISSPNAIDDAADFINRISRGQVMAAGA